MTDLKLILRSLKSHLIHGGFFWVLAGAALILSACSNPTGSNSSEGSIIPADTFVEIPAGTFMMGYPGKERKVTLSKAFGMMKYEVTQEQYEAFMGHNPSRFKSNPAAGETQGKRPVENVSWYDALVFCNRLSIKEGLTPAYAIGGRTDPGQWGAVPTSFDATWNAAVCNWNANGYRLPTEAEWEYACRAGTTTAYYTGAEISDDTGWYQENSGGRTHEVGKKPPNAYGLYDMHGNVGELCWNWPSDYNDHDVDPRGSLTNEPGDPPFRLIRGGGWNSASMPVSVYTISGNNPQESSQWTGLRLVRYLP